MDAVCELAQFVDRQDHLRAGGLEPRRARLVGVTRALRGDPELDRERGEPLLRAVVQVVLEPASLGVGRVDEPRAGGVEPLGEPLALGHQRGQDSVDSAATAM